MESATSSAVEPMPHERGATRRILVAGGLSVLMALPYITRLVPVETEVAMWGIVCLGLGTLLLSLTWVRPSRLQAWSVCAVLIAVVLMQVLPIYLWLILGIASDYPWIQHGYLTRLAFAAAHGAVLVAGLWAIHAMVRTSVLHRLAQEHGSRDTLARKG